MTVEGTAWRPACLRPKHESSARYVDGAGTRRVECVLEMCVARLGSEPCLRGLASPFLFVKGEGGTEGDRKLRWASRPAGKDSDCFASPIASGMARNDVSGFVRLALFAFA